MRLEDGVWRFSTYSSQTFKRCRRKWLFQNILGYTTPQTEYQWIGSCFHDLLEDFHGLRKYSSVTNGIERYVTSSDPQSLPADMNKTFELLTGMYETYMDYMEQYLPENKYKTLYIDGEPQVEVKFKIDLGIKDKEDRSVLFSGIIDRVIEDSDGELWLVDYKTKSKIDTSMLELDPQIGNYLWAASHWYGRPIRGMIYIQLVRAKPQYPNVGKRGDVSVAKTQVTTAALYTDALENVYGSVEEAPEKQQKFLEGLILEEGVSGNRYIRVDRVRRNDQQVYSAHVRLLDEAKDMLAAMENNTLYPNPTRDCSWDCAFQVPCLLMEEQRDALEYMDDTYDKREEEAA